ncbi:hypothetical protein B0A48_18673 [Cryoendolithus antarcticus]|uniref:Glycosyl transferase family 1 domain-containing protein n=1 Tax=Cryoendolithus antarcticus TaxID=1507870 RepID=A0A1V8S8E6_9PEZI|nr:hypothetical protein B0A48_18673 [Cryoendolithus antarcticus]
MDVKNGSSLFEIPHKETQSTSKAASDAHHFIIAKRVLHGLRVLQAGGADVKTSSVVPRTEDHEGHDSLPAIPNRLWVGLSMKAGKDHTIEFGFVCHNGTSTIDFAVQMLHLSHDGSEGFALDLSLDGRAHALEDFLINTLRTISRDHGCKFVGAGIASDMVQACPNLGSRLWTELDILPIMLYKTSDRQDVDEVADVMARKCVLCFGPDLQPRLQVGPLGEVGVDLGGRCTFAIPERYASTVGERSTRMAVGYSHCLRRKHKKLAFFSASSQGRAARTRHALLRYLSCLEVDCSWFVPPPKPEAARIHETVRQILRGEGDRHESFPEAYKNIVDKWTMTIAETYKWTADGGPLASRDRGGAAVIVIDDFTMPALVTIAKRLDPTRTVVLRSHHTLRNELITAPDTCAAHAWQWIWSHIKSADLFISDPMYTHIPRMISNHKLGLMVNSTDWIDGQNKPLSDETTTFYQLDFDHHCERQGVPRLAYPRRDYIIQIADFDSGTALQDAVAAFALFRRQSRYCSGVSVQETPQLLLCGYASANDDSKRQSTHQLRASLIADYPDLKDDIIISGLTASDQTINAMLSRAHVSLDLSQSDDLNVLVSQSLHKGVPCIALNGAGNALQIQHARTGFLVQGLDKQTEIRAVSEYLDILFSDEQRYYDMGFCGRLHLSDEISTVGNAVCWMYLFDRLTSQHKPNFKGGWVWDMAKEQAGEKRRGNEVELPRNVPMV